MGFNTYPGNPFPPDSENSGGGAEPYVLPIAAADTLGGVKVGSGLAIDDGVLSVSGGGGGYNNHTFSTTEQKVGTWIDGRDLFEKTFVAYANGDWQLPLNGNNILTGLTDCDMILVDRFYLKRVDGDNQYWYSVTGDTIVTLVPNAYGGSVYFNISWSAGISYLAFTLRYTKTPTP